MVVNMAGIHFLIMMGAVTSLAQSLIFPDQIFLSSRSSLQQQRPCVPLDQCQSLSMMWESRYIRRNILEAIGALEQAHCGFLGVSNVPIFHCPEDPAIGTQSTVNSGEDFDSTATKPCSGTLKLFVADDPEPEVVIRESRERLSVTAARIVVTGTCCWALHSNTHFEGHSISAKPAGSYEGSWGIKSIEKLTNCP